MDLNAYFTWDKMRERVIVPAYWRPEMLALALESIFRCPDHPEDVVVYVDNHFVLHHHPGINEVVKSFPVQVHYREPHNYRYDIFNVLEAIRAVEWERIDRAYLVEEDVLVSRNFFSWHRSVYDRFPYPFVSVGVRLPKWQTYEYDGVEFNSWFNCGGLCIPNASLKYFSEHATSDYYADIEGYATRMFPKYRGGASYDGLMHRVVWQNNFAVAWPLIPKAMHFGIYGLHRGHWDRLQGTWQEKREEIRVHLNDRAWMARDFEDCAPVESVLSQ